MVAPLSSARFGSPGPIKPQAGPIGEGSAKPVQGPPVVGGDTFDRIPPEAGAILGASGPRPDLGTVVLVEPVSSGADYADHFKTLGARVVALRVSEEGSPGFAPIRRDKFARVLTHRGNYKATLNRIRGLNPSMVVAGAETGVLLTDALNHDLQLDGNDPNLSLEQRDKLAMLRRVQACGLPVAPFAGVNTFEDAMAFQRDINEWPIVIKPPRAAGSYLTQICRNEREVEQALEAINRGTGDYKDGLLPPVTCLAVAMKFLPDAEFAVQLTVRDGVVKNTDTLRYHRDILENGSVRLDCDLLLPHDTAGLAPYRRLAEAYGEALGVLRGPMHVELKQTPDGPVLVELAARPCGAGIPQLIERATGMGQTRLATMAYADPAAFMQHPDDYKIREHLGIVFLTSEGEAHFSSNPMRSPLLEELRRQGVSFEPRFSVEEWEELPSSRNAATTYGSIAVFAPDRRAMLRGVNTLRRMRKKKEFEH